MRLGELLVHTGAITAEQRDKALQQHVVYGARLGTNLIELRYTTPDDIAHALARLLHVPAALGHHFSHADPKLLELVPRTLAVQCTAFPIAFADTGAGRRLVVCLRNPHNAGAVATLTEAAGVQVLACVAPELSLFAWMERGYGIRRHERYRQAARGSADPLPDSDSDRLNAVDPAAAPDQHVDFAVDIDVDEEEDMPAGLQLVELDHSNVERDLSQYAETGKQRQSLLDIASAPTVVPSKPDANVREPVKMTASEALAAITSAAERGMIGSAVIAFLRNRFAAGLMLIAKDAMALGHRGFGGTFDDTTVESILIPLNAPSMFRIAVEAARTCRGRPPSGGKAIHDRFFILFALDGEPADVVVTPVTVRDRVVCLIYAHAEGGVALADDAVAELEHIATAVGEAYIRLIHEAKRA